MSNRYKGGIISATPPTTTGGESGTASGAWTLEQQMQAQAAGLWPAQPTGPYIEDVFSTWLYTGATAPNTIPNGIDLAGKGGLVWLKGRGGASQHRLVDTVRGRVWGLSSDSTSAQLNGGFLDSFNSNGFSLGVGDTGTNAIGNTYVSWTFREQPKFFDIVTYTGNGSNPRTISHNLGSTPGCIIFKSFSDSGYGWVTWHRSLNANGALQVQTTDAEIIDANLWGGSPTDTTFSVSSYSGQNVSGIQYVAYVFAHNAGGFGLSGTDNVISCGSYTGTGAAGNRIELGYEPQFILYKRATGGTGDWGIHDNMRRLGVGASSTSGSGNRLTPNTSDPETGNTNFANVDATGFTITATVADVNGAGSTFIYIAIRRGPMRTPTTGTSVFKPLNETGTGSARTVDAGFPVDTFFIKDRTGLSGPTDGGGNVFYDRLRGNSNVLQTQSTAAEAVNATYTALFNSAQNGVVVGDAWSAYGYREYCFRRAPGFFDEVCYTGTNTTTTQTHSLQAVPELIIVKRRNTPTAGWQVYSATYGRNFYAFLDLTQSFQSDPGNAWGTTDPTTTTFGLSALLETNGAGGNYVAYLFASCPGVSKVGSYTGTGTTQTINCGFTGGARFVMIKRGDSTGDWYVWDSARGIVAGDDPYLLLNVAAADVTGTDFVDTAATGFEITSTAPAAINASGGTFIFLAIA